MLHHKGHMQIAAEISLAAKTFNYITFCLAVNSYFFFPVHKMTFCTFSIGYVNKQHRYSDQITKLGNVDIEDNEGSVVIMLD